MIRSTDLTIGKDPPLCGSSMCSGSNAHLSSSTCFFCFRLASRWKSQNDLKEEKESEYLGIWARCIVHKSILQQRSKDKEDADLWSTEYQVFYSLKEKAFLPQSTRQLPWCRPPGARNCWWRPARERKCQSLMRSGESMWWQHVAAEDGVCCLCGAAPKAEAKMLRRNVGASRMGICTEEEESKKVFWAGLPIKGIRLADKFKLGESSPEPEVS